MQAYYLYMLACIDTHTHIYEYMRMCVHACMHACMHSSLLTHMHSPYMHAEMHACIHTYVHVYMCTRTHVQVAREVVHILA